MKNINLRIKLLRKQLDKSQEELAKELDVTKQAISNMENAKSTPSILVLYKMHTNLNINLNYLIAGTGDIFATQKDTESLKANLLKEVEAMLKLKGIE